MIADPAWEEGVAESLATPFSPTVAYELMAALARPDGNAATTNLMRSLFTPEINETDFAWTMEQVNKIDGKHAATLFINEATQDWRDVVPTITVPTLVVGGEGSVFNAKGMEWIAKQIPDARLKVFKKDQGGSHFMFWENDMEFNQALDGFLNN